MLGEWENKVNGYTSYLGGGGSKGRNIKQEGKQLEIKIELVSYAYLIFFASEGRGGEGRGRFLEKVMSHNMNFCPVLKLMVSRQTDRVSCRGASLLKISLYK